MRSENIFNLLSSAGFKDLQRMFLFATRSGWWQKQLHYQTLTFYFRENVSHSCLFGGERRKLKPTCCQTDNLLLEELLQPPSRVNQYRTHIFNGNLFRMFHSFLFLFYPPTPSIAARFPSRENHPSRGKFFQLSHTHEKHFLAFLSPS